MVKIYLNIKACFKTAVIVPLNSHGKKKYNLPDVKKLFYLIHGLLCNDSNMVLKVWLQKKISNININSANLTRRK